MTKKKRVRRIAACCVAPIRIVDGKLIVEFNQERKLDGYCRVARSIKSSRKPADCRVKQHQKMDPRCLIADRESRNRILKAVIVAALAIAKEMIKEKIIRSASDAAAEASAVNQASAATSSTAMDGYAWFTADVSAAALLTDLIIFSFVISFAIASAATIAALRMRLRLS